MIRPIYLILIISVLSLLVNCSDFLTDPELQKDPNQAVDVSADQLFNGIQVSTFHENESTVNRTLSMWMQQMQGTERQYIQISHYDHTEQEHGEQYENLYVQGGLVDIRKLIEKTSEKGWIAYRGVAKFYEAFRVGMAASIWGDISYSEAVSDVTTPKLDRQSEVYAAIQLLLDDAITDLQGDDSYLPPNDLVFGSDITKWIQACYSLKARYFMHWAEVNAANYNLALQAAQQGISSTAGNFKTHHGAGLYEGNLWSQFNQYRSGYIRSGKYMIDLLKSRNDPRLQLYFAQDDNGGYSGASNGDPDQGTSNLSDAFLAPDHSLDLLTYEETQLIIAECLYKLGDETGALAKLNEVRRAIEVRYGFTANALGVAEGLSDDTLINAIMEEKYIVLFLNMEVYNDWKRTNRPVLQTYAGLPIPRRLYYSNDERSTNPNIPIPAQQPLRNENDPGDSY